MRLAVLLLVFCVVASRPSAVLADPCTQAQINAADAVSNDADLLKACPTAQASATGLYTQVDLCSDPTCTAFLTTQLASKIPDCDSDGTNLHDLYNAFVAVCMEYATSGALVTNGTVSTNGTATGNGTSLTNSTSSSNSTSLVNGTSNATATTLPITLTPLPTNDSSASGSGNETSGSNSTSNSDSNSNSDVSATDTTTVPAPGASPVPGGSSSASVLRQSLGEQIVITISVTAVLAALLS